MNHTEILNRLAGVAAAELSIASDTGAVGVLVAGNQAPLVHWIGGHWNRPWSGPSPRFVRCDLSQHQLRAVTWYRSARRDEHHGLAGTVPATMVAERWRSGRPDERSVYFDVAALRGTRLVDVAMAAARSGGLAPGVVDAIPDLVRRSATAGWPRLLSLAVAGDSPRLKLQHAAPGARRAAEVLDGAADPLLTRFRRLRLPAGYAGFTLSEHGLALRLYARPIDGRHLPRAVAAL
ncbi:hypothetical protein GCM10010172_66770 [Paractinoplanes ferrugineus]|uniref:Uncharacterized protein n=1 Tax=Paractinoplanes ferrugineus TaxID=113564 RepID=A0A919J4E6_9ACTN|nr:hypothetical protein [Actinoplanes ferrugineus]GIE13162.1 hypothetical protein Afe05nite_50020 [Actinoplanes ferrugineus]